MNTYSKKIAFERAILSEINTTLKSDVELISLSENAISNWWEGLHYRNEMHRRVIEKIATDYGFIKAESNTLREFPMTEEELKQVIIELRNKISEK